MSMFDKAKDLAAEHSDQVDKAVDKGGDAFDERTGGKYSDKTDTAQQHAEDYLSKQDQQSTPDRP